MSMHTTFSLTEAHISICDPYNQLQLLENTFSDFPLSPVDRDPDILQKKKKKKCDAREVVLFRSGAQL